MKTKLLFSVLCVLMMGLTACEDKNTPIKGHAYVDLGLPSGLKWATMNIGATSPEKYGNYFAWGEPQPEKPYFWGDYKYCWFKKTQQEYIPMLTKYCLDSNDGEVDNKITLEPEDDAAQVNWGGDWRMPTKAEFEELKSTCTWTWTMNKGINGYSITGPNGNTIFMPAAGYYAEYDLRRAGEDGYYWSSSLDEDFSANAYSFYFSKGYDFGEGNYYATAFLDKENRFYGYTVRAVCK